MCYFRFEKGFLKYLKSKINVFIICDSNIKSIFKSYQKSSDTILNFSLQNMHFKPRVNIDLEMLIKFI